MREGNDTLILSTKTPLTWKEIVLFPLPLLAMALPFGYSKPEGLGVFLGLFVIMSFAGLGYLLFRLVKEK